MCGNPYEVELEDFVHHYRYLSYHSVAINVTGISGNAEVSTGDQYLYHLKQGIHGFLRESFHSPPFLHITQNRNRPHNLPSAITNRCASNAQLHLLSIQRARPDINSLGSWDHLSM